MKKSIKFIACALLASVFLFGCADKEYYNAIRAQNETIWKINSERAEREAQREKQHEALMMQLITNGVVAASKTEDKTDDVLVPMLIMNMENQRIMADALKSRNTRTPQLQQIKAPDSIGDIIRKSTGAILGGMGLYVNMKQSSDMRDVAIQGMSHAGTNTTVNGDGNSTVLDSYKSGSQNSVVGDSNTSTYTGGDVATTVEQAQQEATEEK